MTSVRYLRKACLSIPVIEVASNSAIPCDCHEGIWRKAATLHVASSSDAITFVLGGNELDKMVQSSTPIVPRSAPFKLSLLCRNITCHGCQNKFLCTGTPNDLIVQHEEDRSYTSPVTSLQAFKYGNAYYHPQLDCIRQKWPAFAPSDVVILPDIMEMAI